METRRLGRTDLEISILSIGGLYTSSLAGGVVETQRIMRGAIELGINAIDTAPAYADSEKTVGEATVGIDAPLIVTTKLGGRPQPFDPQDIADLRQSVDESLRLLGRDHIDILMVHEPDRPQQYAWWTCYDPLEGPALHLMDELKGRGQDSLHRSSRNDSHRDDFAYRKQSVRRRADRIQLQCAISRSCQLGHSRCCRE